MALDGLFLHCIAQELDSAVLGAKVDKVYQPSSEELVLTLRS
ncbi:MAG: NFACT family protein, partial [Clostridia bacterium]|nr:NFACT family protein [Clostridia bacterium]